MCEVIASSNTFRVKQKRLHLGIIYEVMTLVRDIEGCGMIIINHNPIFTLTLTLTLTLRGSNWYNHICQWESYFYLFFMDIEHTHRTWTQYIYMLLWLHSNSWLTSKLIDWLRHILSYFVWRHFIIYIRYI